MKNIMFLVLALVVMRCDESSSSYSEGGRDAVYIDKGIIKAKDWAAIGDSGYIKGKLYVIVDRSFLNSYNDLTRICTSKITSMAELNLGENFNQDISRWDLSNVTNMSNMFSGCKFFNQDISKWDVSNVTNMYGTFYNAAAFNQNLEVWNVAKVNSYQMFDMGANSWQNRYKPIF
jgi:surface protein